MHPSSLSGLGKQRDTLEDLKKEIDGIKNDIIFILNLGLTQETKTLAVRELQAKKEELKEKMHNLIDSL